MVHSQSGYSESSIATGSDLSLKKLRPRRGVPAGTEDCATAAGDFFFAGRSWEVGEAGIGVVNGSAAADTDALGR